MAAGLTPTGREDIATVVTGPVIKGSLPPVKCDVDLVVVQSPHRSAADQMGIFLVDSLQLLTDRKLVHLWCGRFLLK